MPRKSNPKSRRTVSRSGGSQRSSRDAAREKHPSDWSLLVMQISNAGKKPPEGR